MKRFVVTLTVLASLLLSPAGVWGANFGKLGPGSPDRASGGAGAGGHEIPGSRDARPTGSRGVFGMFGLASRLGGTRAGHPDGQRSRVAGGARTEGSVRGGVKGAPRSLGRSGLLRIGSVRTWLGRSRTKGNAKHEQEGEHARGGVLAHADQRVERENAAGGYGVSTTGTAVNVGAEGASEEPPKGPASTETTPRGRGPWSQKPLLRALRFVGRVAFWTGPLATLLMTIYHPEYLPFHLGTGYSTGTLLGSLVGLGVNGVVQAAKPWDKDEVPGLWGRGFDPRQAEFKRLVEADLAKLGERGEKDGQGALTADRLKQIDDEASAYAKKVLAEKAQPLWSPRTADLMRRIHAVFAQPRGFLQRVRYAEGERRDGLLKTRLAVFRSVRERSRGRVAGWVGSRRSVRWLVSKAEAFRENHELMYHGGLMGLTVALMGGAWYGSNKAGEVIVDKTHLSGALHWLAGNSFVASLAAGAAVLAVKAAAIYKVGIAFAKKEYKTGNLTTPYWSKTKNLGKSGVNLLKNAVLSAVVVPLMALTFLHSSFSNGEIAGTVVAVFGTVTLLAKVKAQADAAAKTKAKTEGDTKASSRDQAPRSAVLAWRRTLRSLVSVSSLRAAGLLASLSYVAYRVASGTVGDHVTGQGHPWGLVITAATFGLGGLMYASGKMALAQHSHDPPPPGASKAEMKEYFKNVFRDSMANVRAEYRWMVPSMMALIWGFGPVGASFIPPIAGAIMVLALEMKGHSVSNYLKGAAANLRDGVKNARVRFAERRAGLGLRRGAGGAIARLRDRLAGERANATSRDRSGEGARGGHPSWWKKNGDSILSAGYAIVAAAFGLFL